MITSITATITTNASGAATVYLGHRIYGTIEAIKYVPGTLDTGAGLTFTGEDTEVPVLVKAGAGTSTVWFYPRVLANKNTDGAAATDALVAIRLFKERLKLVVASGGNAVTGTVTVFVNEDK